MNRPPGLNGFLFPVAENAILGSVETPPLLRVMRPATFALWFILFTVQAIAVVGVGEGGNWVLLLLSTSLFAGVHVQFWYEESEQGRRVHRALERMRGTVYEDEATGLPNTRHFVFELRRQMMRSMRSGSGFSLLLADLAGTDRARKEDRQLAGSLARSLRHAAGEGDFLAYLDGGVFAAIVTDDRTRTVADKSDAVLLALGSCIPLDRAGTLYPVVALTGYEGEIEVRDFLRRAQRDFVAARSRGTSVDVIARRVTAA